jgi:hypothetical protein
MKMVIDKIDIKGYWRDERNDDNEDCARFDLLWDGMVIYSGEFYNCNNNGHHDNYPPTRIEWDKPGTIVPNKIEEEIIEALSCNVQYPMNFHYENFGK